MFSIEDAADIWSKKKAPLSTTGSYSLLAFGPPDSVALKRQRDMYVNQPNDIERSCTAPSVQYVALLNLTTQKLIFVLGAEPLLSCMNIQHAAFLGNG